MASSMATLPFITFKPGVVFLLDVDNTLLDNDRFAADLRARLEQAFGAAEATNTTINPPPDRTIERIGDLCERDLDSFLADGSAAATAADHATVITPQSPR